jgi:hypothetical protein
LSYAPTTATPEPDAAPSLPLGEVIAASTAGFPVVRLDGTTLGVVTACHDMRADVLLDDGERRSEPLDRPAALITDPALEARLLRRAARRLQHRARSAAFDRDCQQHEHERTLGKIRAYVIARHRDREICRDGLDAFLEHFGMDAYQPLIRVRFTVSGSYLVRGGSAGEAESDGGYLRLDTSRVDDVVDDSEEYQVDIDSAEELDDE